MGMNRESLAQCGISYDDAVEKFLGEAELYESLLVNFLDDNSFDEAKVCVENGDCEGVIRTVHAMKSVTGTLCMNVLYRKCCEVVDDARANDTERMKADFAEAYEMYQKIAECIRAEAAE